MFLNKVKTRENLLETFLSGECSMRIKTENVIFCSVAIFNIVSGIRKYLKMIVSCAILLSACIIGSSHADTWIDDFDAEVLNGWERIVEENPWFAKWILIDDPGRLYGGIVKPKQEEVTAADFLRWNAHQFQLKRLTVVGEEIRYDRHAHNRSGELCLFLGKKQTEPNFAKGYIFSPEKVTKMQFSTKGIFKKGEVKADYALMFRLTSGDLKVVFDTGKFQLWTQDLLITEFIDADITLIDVVGLIVLHKFPGAWFGGTISTFSISGSGIPNHNSLDVQLRSTQMTTTWGELKRF